MQVAPAAAAAPAAAPVSVAPATAVPGAPAAAPAAVPAVETVELNPAYQDGPVDGVPVTLQPLDSAPDTPGPGKDIPILLMMFQYRVFFVSLIRNRTASVVTYIL